MGAQDVLEFMEKNPGVEFVTPDIAKKINENLASVSRILRNLIKDATENIKFRELTHSEKKERYGKAVAAKIKVYWIQ